MEQLLTWADHRVFKGAGNPIVFAVNDASLFSLSREAHETLRKWRKSRLVDFEPDAR